MKYSRATSSFTLNDQKLTSIFTRVSALTKCEHKQLEMKNKRCDKIKFVPRCNKDGSFAEVQCLAATRTCWCVDEHGRERNGTRQNKKPTTCQVSRPGNLPSFTTISREVVGKNVHVKIQKGNTGYDQYTVPDTVAV